MSLYVYNIKIVLYSVWTGADLLDLLFLLYLFITKRGTKIRTLNHTLYYTTIRDV